MRWRRASSDGALKWRSSRSRASRERRRRQPLEELGQQHEIERGLGAFVHQLRDGQADGARDPPQENDRAIAEPGLELGEIALGDFRVACECLARHAALVAQHAHALAEPAQIGVGLAAVAGLAVALARGFIGLLIALFRHGGNMHYNAEQ